MKNRMLVTWEVAVLIASVFVFRSLWLLLDQLPLMKKTGMLWLTLLSGGIIAALALSRIAKQGKE